MFWQLFVVTVICFGTGAAECCCAVAAACCWKCVSAVLQALEFSLSLEVAMCFLATFWYLLSKLTLKKHFFSPWKGKVYRMQALVMDSDGIPNVLSWNTTFLMGILKPCFVVKTVPEIPDGTATMDFNSKPEMKNSKRNKKSQMNCSGSTNTKKLVKIAVTPKDRQYIHLDSLKSKPLAQEMIETAYQDVFQGLRKFPGDLNSDSRRTTYLLSIDHKRFQSTFKMYFTKKYDDLSKLMYSSQWQNKQSGSTWKKK